MPRRSSRTDLREYDEVAEGVAALSYADWLRRMPESQEEQAAWMRLRLRWRLDEFAQVAMRPLLAKNGVVSDPCEIDEVIFGATPYRVGDPRRGLQALVMTGRGIGKSTRQKIRSFHGLLFGLRKVSVTICASDPDVIGWIDGIRAWCEDPGPFIGVMFPELAASGDMHRLIVRTRFGEQALFARTVGGALRGFNHRNRRPDALDIDDIETEDKSLTIQARDAMKARITGKILPLVPVEGGCEVTWTQTPVHPDANSVRAQKGDEDLSGWDVYSIPVLTRWPDRTDLWEEARRIFFDRTTTPRRSDRLSALMAFYAENKAAMDEGWEGIDPVRMGPIGCHLKLWSVGKTAFSREYLMSSKSPGNVFDPWCWPRHRVEGEAIQPAEGPPVAITSLRLHAHLDTSDGGDDGALVVCAGDDGFVWELESKIFQATKITEQIKGVPLALRRWVRMGLSELHYEPPPGAGSEIERALRAALDDAELSGVVLIPVISSRNKNNRITSTLEPMQEAGTLSVRHEIDRRAMETAAAFDARRPNNADDWLDAMQRCAESLADLTGASVWDGIAAG